MRSKMLHTYMKSFLFLGLLSANLHVYPLDFSFGIFSRMRMLCISLTAYMPQFSYIWHPKINLFSSQPLFFLKKFFSFPVTEQMRRENDDQIYKHQRLLGGQVDKHEQNQFSLLEYQITGVTEELSQLQDRVVVLNKNLNQFLDTLNEAIRADLNRHEEELNQMHERLESMRPHFTAQMTLYKKEQETNMQKFQEAIQGQLCTEKKKTQNMLTQKIDEIRKQLGFAKVADAQTDVLHQFSKTLPSGFFKSDGR